MFDSKDSKTIGYHLFFLPSGELFDTMQNIINVLAEKYHGATFEPHVTLLARIPKIQESDLIEKTKKLASIMEPFEIEPKEICAEDTYFRALYCKAEYNIKLEKYHQEALKMFGVEDVNIYMPHLSLYYGLVSQSTKDIIIASLSLPESMKFLADTLYLYRTEGEAKDWIRVGSYALGKS